MIRVSEVRVIGQEGDQLGVILTSDALQMAEDQGLDLDGHKAKVTIVFRGREMAHTELGRRILDRMAGELEDVSTIEQTPKQEGRNLAMVLSPRSS